MDVKKIEYRVRPVTRYVITHYEESGGGGSVGTKGEYDNAHVAYEVAYALCKAEHERLGFPPGDERIQYPVHPLAPLDNNAVAGLIVRPAELSAASLQAVGEELAAH